MRKMFAVAAAALTVSMLAGCSGGAKLDREAEVDEMNFKVPSTYADKSDENNNLYKNGDNAIQVIGMDWVEDADDVYEIFIGNIEDSVEVRELDSGVIDGHEYATYSVGDNDAMIFHGPEGGYYVCIYGDEVSADKFLDNVTFD